MLESNPQQEKSDKENHQFDQVMRKTMQKLTPTKRQIFHFALKSPPKSKYNQNKLKHFI